MINKPTPTPKQAALITKLQAERMRPKFSRHLANFVKNRLATRVFLVTPLATAPSWERSSLEYKPKGPKGRVSSRMVFLSDRVDPWSSDYFHGTDLSTVVSTGGSQRVSARSWKRKDWQVEDITDWFWARYAEIGKCLWDWEHVDYGFTSRSWSNSKPNGDDERFVAIDDQTCKCKWCGDVLHLRRSVVVEIRVRHQWTHAKVNGSAKTFRCLRCHRPHPIADFHQDLRGYSPLRSQNGQPPKREEIRLKKSGYCPKCFIAVTVAHPADRQALLPTELLTPLKINT